MHAITRGHEQPVASTRRGDPRIAGPASPGRRAKPAALCVALAAGLVAAACSSDSSLSRLDLSPTFSRATGESLVFEAPLASVGGMLPPTGEGEPWTIVGAVLDPGRRTSVAATWTSDEGARWTRTDVDPADGGTSEMMSAVAASDDGPIAVGAVGDGPKGDAAVWRRVDDEWERVDAEALGGRHEQWAFAVASGDGGTLVAGAESAWGEVRPRLWLSTDGETWETVDGGAGGPLDGTGSETLRDITAYGDGFVAVGSRQVENEQDGLAWYSPDGRSWEEVPADTLGGPGRQALLSVVATGGELVAGGYAVDDDGEGRPVVWRSTDGTGWGQPSSPLPLHDDARTNAGDLAVRSLSVNDGTVFAAGGSDWRPHVWRSTDAGRSWERLPNPVHGGLFKDGVALVDAAARGDIVLALGLEPTVLRLSDGRWQDATGHPQDGTSSASEASVSCLPDGRRDAPVPLPTDEQADGDGGGDGGEGNGEGAGDGGGNGGGDAGGDGGAEQGGGGDGGGDAPEAGEQPSEGEEDEPGEEADEEDASEFPDGGVQPFATSVARKDGTTVVVGGRYTAPRGATRECYAGQVWTLDGGTWQPIESNAFDHGRIVDVTAYDGGFVAVGFEDFGVAAQRKLIGADVSPDAIIWTSPDGEEWTRIASHQPRVDQEDLELIPDATQEMAGAIVSLEAEQAPMSDPPAGGDGTHSLAGVAPVGKGFAAAGVRYDGQDVAPIMLVSGDAESIEAQDTGFTGDGARQFRDVCVGPDDVIVAVGDAGRDADYDIAAFRRDPDQGWSKENAVDLSFGGPGRQYAYGCAGGRDGFILVGSDDRGGDPDAGVWVSEDGTKWSRILDGSFGGSGEQWASAAAAVPGGGWLVAGTDTAAGDGDIALWWISPDGEVARRDRNEPALGGPGEQTVTNMLVDGDGVVLVGEDHGRVGLWTSDTLDR
ncbi:MAG: WD40/YVTN/BNR-like repeat-containing protein [Acidimicrobiia bacterium]